MENTQANDRDFTRGMLPWVIAGTGLLVYLATLNTWVSFSSLGQVARVSGWTWQPDLTNPVFWLLTYPFRWLPDSLIPVALNLFTAVSAALTLWLLARTVSLLPYNRTEEQRTRQTGKHSLLTFPYPWIPPVVAAMICGLQLSFWEHATAVTGEMLDLLLFAFVARCLAEYRIDSDQKWLTRAAFVYGAAMTNNWAMIGFLPLYFAALLLLKGRSFFDLGWLMRMFLAGLLGLSFYLLLPIVTLVTSTSDISFWQALKYNLGAQKNFLTLVPLNKELLFKGETPLWVIGLPSIIPLIIMGIKWPAAFGDQSKLGVSIANWTFHIFHGVILILAIWVALDPAMSPRRLMPGLPLLTIYFLSALVAGYACGYFLLVFKGKTIWRHFIISPATKMLSPVVVGAVLALLLVIPVALLARNLASIRTTNGPALRTFSDLMVQTLKPGSVVLSDDPRRTALALSAATHMGKGRDYMFLDTPALNWPDYHRYIGKRYPGRWPIEVPPEVKMVDQPSLQRVVTLLAQTNTLQYLHPSFGYYFEYMYPVPQALTYTLVSYGTNVHPPELDERTVAQNQVFWNNASSRIFPRIQTAIRQTTQRDQATLRGKIMKALHLTREPNRDAVLLGSFYSRSVNAWGTREQELKLLKDAERRFKDALALNPENLVAEINLACNQDLQQSSKGEISDSRALIEQFNSRARQYRTWEQMVSENGPFDEPNYTYEQGRLFARGNLLRQASLEFHRVKELQPSHVAARLWLAQVYAMGHAPELALKEIRNLKDYARKRSLTLTNDAEILLIESSALLTLGDLQGAEQVVKTTLEKAPRNEALIGLAAQVFLDYGAFTNALPYLDRQLQLNPNNQNALVNKGFALLQTGQAKSALDPLNRALELDPGNHTAMMNRAVALLHLERYEEAKPDYLALQKVYPETFQIYYGLGEIAYKGNDYPEAARNYSLYLSYAPANTAEAELVRKRLQELTPSAN